MAYAENQTHFKHLAYPRAIAGGCYLKAALLTDGSLSAHTLAQYLLPSDECQCSGYWLSEPAAHAPIFPLPVLVSVFSRLLPSGFWSDMGETQALCPFKQGGADGSSVPTCYLLCCCCPTIGRAGKACGVEHFRRDAI